MNPDSALSVRKASQIEEMLIEKCSSIVPVGLDDVMQVFSLLTPLYANDLSSEQRVKELAVIWAVVFKNVESGRLFKAVLAHMVDTKKGMFMPKPGDIAEKLQYIPESHEFIMKETLKYLRGEL